jgi:hypothetical protein
MTTVLNVPYVQAHYQGDYQRPTSIILTPSFTTSDKGAALAVALRWHSKTSPHDSGHYTVDEEDSFSCTPDDSIAGYGASVQKNAIRITMCAEPVSCEDFWDLSMHHKVLDQTALLVAMLCAEHKIRPVWLDENDQMRWQKHRWRRRGGIFVDVSYNFPQDWFMTQVENQLR